MAAAFNALPLPRTRFDPRNTILLAGTPRSGTTWVGQILGAAEGFALVNEPLGLKMPGVERAGFSWATWQPPDAEWPAGEAVLRRYFTGRGMSVKLLLRNRLGALVHRGLVIKEVKANRLLPWISRRFELRGILHLVRHPCAVVSSQIEYFPERDPCVPDNIAYVERCMPELLPWATALRTEWEERALTWALDQLVPLRAAGERSWLTVHYETLVMDGERELERILAALRIPASPAIRQAHAANSWQARARSVDHATASAEERLGVWRRRLSTEQVHDILEVCDRCGLHLYGDANMPTAA
jgi:hypothetical protein